MPLQSSALTASRRPLQRIVVIGAGPVGVPMAVLLAAAPAVESEPPPEVLLLQRNSPASGWKVGALNAGRSPVGGDEPDLPELLAAGVASGRLRATHDAAVLAAADAVVIATQTDVRGEVPDHEPLLAALDALGAHLPRRPAAPPLVLLECTLAPSAMASVVRPRLTTLGLAEDRDLLLALSPSRVQPGRLVARLRDADKLVAGTTPGATAAAQAFLRRVVTGGTLHPTNCLTAELVKALENGWRDVRLAYTGEVARFTDAHGVDFYALRAEANAALAQADEAASDRDVVPSGGLLIPTLGVGGPCLPKDGLLLRWRAREGGLPRDRSVVVTARCLNDEAPRQVLAQMEHALGPLNGRAVALLGAAYRADAGETRHSPALVLARLLLGLGARVTLHDPHVYPTDPELRRAGLAELFTRDLAGAVAPAEVLVLCAAHREYQDGRVGLLALARRATQVFDACNAWQLGDAAPRQYAGIGRGTRAPSAALVADVVAGFRAVERGMANEVAALLAVLNARYAPTPAEQATWPEVRRLAATCPTGCVLVEPGEVALPEAGSGFRSALVSCSAGGIFSRPPTGAG